MKLIGQPDFLLIHFKRFRNASGDHWDKLDNESDPFSTVAIANQNDERVTYAPICSVEHRGGSATSGHYVCHVFKDDAWYTCNDTTVTPLAPADRTPTKAAYLILLQRRHE